jgi:hypothetical protein
MKERRGWHRLAAYVVVLLAVMSCWTLRAASAEMTRMSLALGRDLLPLSDLLTERARVDINGEHVWAASALTSSSVHSVLDRFETHCREGGATGITWGSGAAEKPAVAQLVDVRGPQGPQMTLGVLRSEAGDEGAILCFPKKGETSSFMARLRGFAGSMDLGELGQMRYAYVRRDHDKTHVLTMWTDQHLRLDKMAGIDGAEPGFDNPDLPRPVRSRRIVSTSIDGTPYGALGYLSQAAPGDVLSAYSRDMVGRGWTEARTIDDSVLAFMKDGSLVTFATRKTDDGTLIGIAEMGVDPAVAPHDEPATAIME